MKVLVATDAHIYVTEDGKYWTSKIYGYEFWTRYLDVFDEVRIVARLKKVSKGSNKWLRVDGPNVEIWGIPFYQGPKQLAIKYMEIQMAMKGAYKSCSVAIFRLPSQTAYMAFRHMPFNMPCAGEIVYDPTDDVNNRSRGVLLHILDVMTSNQLKRFCKRANGVSYVTENVIQRHYPCKARLEGESKQYFESYYSTITLNDTAFRGTQNFEQKPLLTLALSDVSMNTERKGERTLIYTVDRVLKRGYDINAIIIGDGIKKKEFMELTESLGIEKYVRFTGLLSSAEEVRKVLCEADIFFFPTTGEGLPRGILEAMALGMPVLSTPVGGITEVIDKKYLFAPNDIDGYTEKICYLMDHREELNEMSKSNYTKSLEFHNTKLQKRRNIFYKKLKNLTQ